MSIDSFSPDFAPYHLVQVDLPCAQGLGRYYDLQLALSNLDAQRRAVPEHEYALVSDGGLIDDSKLKRIPRDPMPERDYLRAASVQRLPKKPSFKIVRHAA